MPRNRKYSAARVADGKCTECQRPHRENRTLCDVCNSNKSRRAKQRRIVRRESGLCMNCPVPATVNEFCFDCWLKTLVYNALGTITGNGWQEMKQKLEDQKFRCAYTGQSLIPGVNASIDHKTPRSKGGLNTTDNLWWVTKQVNLMKTNVTHENFIAICRQVSALHSPMVSEMVQHRLLQSTGTIPAL